jgi:hypothetical protein
MRATAFSVAILLCGCGTASVDEHTEPPASAANTAATESSTAEAAPAAPPKCEAAEHRQFDFWIGEWDVKRGDGTAAGHNTIEAILDGCVLRETYAATSSPYRGTSLNIYDAGRKQWHQSWVDNTGLLLSLDGGLVDGKMVLRGTTQGPDGELLHEIAWTPLEDGRVKQHWRASKDGGGTWKDVFVGFYSKVK